MLIVIMVKQSVGVTRRSIENQLKSFARRVTDILRFKIYL
jgi:hypothetical protein